MAANFTLNFPSVTVLSGMITEIQWRVEARDAAYDLTKTGSFTVEPPVAYNAGMTRAQAVALVRPSIVALGIEAELQAMIDAAKVPVAVVMPPPWKAA